MVDFEKIRSRRKKLGLTQEAAAQKAGLPGKQRWSDIESGRRGNVTVATLEAVAAALGVKARSLLK